MVDLIRFAPIKYFIEDSIGVELIRQINEVYPDINLDFLLGKGIIKDGGSLGGDVATGNEADPKGVELKNSAPETGGSILEREST